ncbi:DUF3422 family protein [Comamonas flocculans]|uniref:DUF3422 domain-containing protein n=1 Tax=Comamonas flocculans TaxID=2597701 RepID=A0A5B8RQU2_9BURK|nr:DUF3422 domain-containing protein [Comamonas flocculans]QEA12000.1 DUF3422 domain-containing protein [Comamonas flocculans]
MTAPTAPPSHSQRALLHEEIHARPPQPVTAPQAISHVVMWADAPERDASRAHLAALLQQRGLAAPPAGATHWRADLGSLRVVCEMHTEFVSWTFATALAPEGLGQEPPAAALGAVPGEWLAGLPGQCLCRLDLWVLDRHSHADGRLVAQVLQEGTLVASCVAGGQAEVYTDFALRADGSSRMVLLAGSLSPRRLGRAVQRLLEMETYRMTALLGLPLARDAAGALARAERELAQLAEAIRLADRDAEPRLLDELTRLAGQVESLYAATHARFSASSAYFDLVAQRIRELGETPLAGLQTLGDFMDRRLSPARNTCEWAVRRQNALSERVSRTSNLLRTRVEIAQQQSSQQLLAAMNRRQDMQLRLQSTVEGLSVAAITYYVVGLISYLAQGAQALGWPWSAPATAAAAIPVVALAVWWSLRRMHHRLFRNLH